MKAAILRILKSEFIKLALKKVLGNSLAGGFKAWLIKFIAKELYEEVAEPLIKYAIRKGMLGYDKVEGAIKVRKYEKAKEDHNEDGYTTTISNV